MEAASSAMRTSTRSRYHCETVKCIHAANDWFGARTAEEDELGIQTILKESLPPSGLFVLDMTPKMNGR
jgi:hypothetical protein